MSPVGAKGQATRQSILDGAVQLASRVGLGGLSIAVLADEVDMSKSGLFAHFRSKEQLQLQTLDHARRQFVDAVVRPGLHQPDGERRLRAFFDHWLTWDEELLSGGCLFVAAAVELDDQPGMLRDALVRSEREWLDLLTTTVRSAVDNGELAVDPAQLAYEIHALMLGHHHASRLVLGRVAATQRSAAGLGRLLAAARPAR